MQKQGKLFSHTLILGIGAVVAKTVSFFLLPLYTAAMTPSEFGTADIFVNTAVLLLPLVSLHAPEAVFRFRAGGERGAFGAGLIFVGIGLALFALSLPLFGISALLRPLVGLLFFYVCASVLRSFLAHTLRADGAFGLYALQQVFCALLTALLQYLLLFVWELGVAGYLLGVVLADATTFLLLLLCLLGRWWQKGKITRALCGKMLRFSLPLIPTAALWWVTAVSDRYFVLRFCGERVTGLYAAAGRLPTLLSFVIGVFLEAWHYAWLGATEKGRQGLFARVYDMMLPTLFCGGALLALLSRSMVRVLLAPSYAQAAEFVPLLVLGALCGGLSNYLDSIYSLYMKTRFSLQTALVAAAGNLLLNLLLIPWIGALGAAFSTALSYALLFFLRLWHTRRYLTFERRGGKTALSVFLLLVGGGLLGRDYLLAGSLFCVLTLLLHLKGGWRTVVFLVRRGVVFLKSLKKTSKKQEKI